MVLKNLFKVALVCMSIFVIACESIEEDSSSLVVEESTQKLNVLATTPMLAEYVRQIGNDNIDLNILMPYSADPHSFEASPQDAKKIADADLVFYIGLKYESAGVVEMLENSVSSEGILIEIGSNIDPIEFSEEGNDAHEGNDDHEADDDHEGHDDHEADDDHEGHDDHEADDDHEGHDDHEADDDHEGHGHGIYDPHFWFDPIRVSKAVEVIKDELVKNDSANENSYKSAATNFVTELQLLDENISAMFNTIPAENRKIITTHEALGYLEAKYEIEVLTTIIPSLNSEDSITPKSLKRAIDIIEEHNIKVMFLEAESSSQYSEVIEQETGIKLISGLWVETLQENQSYLNWLENNVAIIVDNLSKEVYEDHDDDHDDDDHDDDDHDDDHDEDHDDDKD
jgi:zinc/manganese transport system substrate-binding protein